MSAAVGNETRWVWVGRCTKTTDLRNKRRESEKESKTKDPESACEGNTGDYTLSGRTVDQKITNEIVELEVLPLVT